MTSLTLVADGGSLSDRVIEEIRSYMGRRMVTQVQLADALGISQAGVSARLKGRTPISVPELATIAHTLDVDPVVLMGGVPAGGGPSPNPGITRGYMDLLSPNSDDMQLSCNAPLALAA